MNTKAYLISEGVINLIFGISLIFFPASMAQEYLVNAGLQNEITDLLCQQFGVLLLGAAIANFYAAKAETSISKTGVILMGLFSNWAYAIVHFMAINKGLETSFAWGTVAIQVIWGIWALLVLSSKK